MNAESVVRVTTERSKVTPFWTPESKKAETYQTARASVFSEHSLKMYPLNSLYCAKTTQIGGYIYNQILAGADENVSKSGHGRDFLSKL